MKNTKVLFMLVGLFLICSRVQGMKRKLELDSSYEISPFLLQAVHEKVIEENLLQEILQDKKIEQAKKTYQNKEQYYCTLCNSWFTSARGRKRHNKTKRHQALALAMFDNADLRA